MENEHNTRNIRSFVRRQGRITPGQQRALETLWPRYGLSGDTSINLDREFGRQAPRTLEIGFGNGTALATLAGSQPENDFIGIEVHRPGVGHLLQAIETNELENVRILCMDAIPVLENCLADRSLDRLLLFFPDPWHKKRHHKRRIVQSEFIQLVANKLKQGGILHMATDWKDYAQQMLAVANSSPEFTNCDAGKSYSPRPAYRPVTKFEQRGQRLGHGVWDLLYQRR